MAADEGLFPASGKLLQGAAGTATDLLKLSGEGEADVASIAEKSAQTATQAQSENMRNQTEIQRQRMEGQQRIQQAIISAKNNADEMRQKYLQDTVEVPPEFAAGLAKATGNPGYEQFSGQRMPWKEMFAGATAQIKARYTKPISTQIMVDGKPNQIVLTPTEDKNGNITWTPQTVGEAVPRPAGRGGTGGTGAKPKTSEDWFKIADKARNEINTTFSKKGGVPTATIKDKVLKMFGGQPSEQTSAKIASIKQNYSDYQTAVENYNTLAEKEGKKPIQIDPLTKQAMDHVLSLDTTTTVPPPAAGNPDQQVIDFLKDGTKNGTGKVVRDTPANRAWAKEQIGG